MISVEQFLSQSWINKNKYSLSKDSIDSKEYSHLIKEGLKTLGLRDQNTVSYSKNRVNEFCNWLSKSLTIEPRCYDIVFPSTYAQPVDFFIDHKFYNLLLYVCDSDKLHNNLFPIDFLDKVYESKNEDYMPKSLLFEYIEFAWLAYDDRSDAIVVHHNQLNGDLSHVFSNNQKLWFFRFIVRTFVQKIPVDRRRAIYVPEISTYLKFLERKMGHRKLAIYPYSKEVMQKSDFELIPYSEFKQLSPIAASQTDITDYLDESEILFWRYEHDNPHSLANTLVS